MSSVRIEDDAFGDLRYERLARECGLADADHARGKMARLWRQCTAEKRYSLAVEDVQAVLGDNAVTGLVASRLGEVVNGGIRIKGTKGRIEWLEKLRKNGKFGKLGGRPTKVSKQNPRGYPDGFRELTPPSPVSSPSPSPSPVSVPAQAETPEKGPVKPAQRPESKALAGQAETIEAFDAAYRLAYSVKPTWGVKQVGQIKGLIGKHGAEEVQRRIRNLFASPPDWLQPPFDVGTLVQHFDKFALASTRRLFGSAAALELVREAEERERARGQS